MKNLFEELKIRNTIIKNRICVPPMVCHQFSDEYGMVSKKNLQHYTAIAKANFGLVIVEATAIDTIGKLAPYQLGLWEEAQIEGHKQIVNEYIKENVPVILQIHHAGVMGVVEGLVSASDYTLGEKHARALTIEEIQELEDKFVQSALWAEKAGYNGVEIHGAHSYLITQFLNSRVNKRDDIYGKDKMLFVKNIYNRIRKEVHPDFIIGIRLGAYEPTLEDGINHAKQLEQMGLDFISVSFGFMAEMDDAKPKDYEFSSHVYGAMKIKEHITIPVFAVNGIKSKEQAQKILETSNVDMICIGRGVLVNYNWANDAKENKDVGKCLECPTCFWRVQRSDCPGKILLDKTANTIAN